MSLGMTWVRVRGRPAEKRASSTERSARQGSHPSAGVVTAAGQLGGNNAPSVPGCRARLPAGHEQPGHRLLFWASGGAVHSLLLMAAPHGLKPWKDPTRKVHVKGGLTKERN